MKDYVEDPAGVVSYYVGDESDDNNLSGSTINRKEILDRWDVSLSAQTISLDPDTPSDLQAQLIFDKDARRSALPVRLSLTSTGSDCLMINTTNTCTSPYVTVLNESSIIPLRVLTNQAGTVIAKVELCASQPSVCIQESHRITITPAPITQLQLLTPYSVVPYATPVPFKIQATDQYNNQITSSLTPYTIRTTEGVFGVGSTGFSLSRFSQSVTLQ